MTAPHLEPTISISSSGRTDGLGRRELYFDRETGDMLERLHARPEIALFETAIRERIEQLAGFNDPRFARVRTAERLDGSLTVLSDFIPGQTLADLFDAARDLSIVPGLDAALGYLVEGLYAVAALHRGAGGAHGLIAPERTLFTADGGLVFLDAPYSTTIDRLALSRRRLWTEFGIRGTSSGSHHSLEPAGDVSQVALSTVMLILGRRLSCEDVEQLEALMPDVAEVALIRGSVAFATSLQGLLERLLPLPGHQPYPAADDAIADLRELLDREIGLDACRSALVEFVGQCNPAAADASHESTFDADPPHESAIPPDTFAWPDEDLPSGPAVASHDPDVAVEPAEGDDPAVEFEINLDEGDSESPRRSRGVNPSGDDEEDEDEGELFDFSNFDLSKNIGAFTPNVLRRIEPPVDLTPPPLDELDTAALTPSVADAFAFAAPSDHPEAASTGSDASPAPPAAASAIADPAHPTPVTPAELTDPPAGPAEGGATVGGPSTFDWGTLVPTAVSDAPIQLVAGIKPRESALFGTAPASAPAYGEIVPAPLNADAAGASGTAGDAPSGERRRRHKKAGRAQKDRLRSAAKPEASPSTWLVPPEKQAKFEQVTPEPALSPFRPAAIQSPPAPAIQLPFAAPVPGVMANRPPVIPLAPVVVPPPPPAAPLPKFANPPAIAPMPLPTAGLGSTISMIDPDEAFAPVKVKADLPSGYAPAGRNSRRSERPKPARHVVEDVSEPPPVVVEEEVTLPPTARIFPVKLAIAVVVLAVVGVLVGRASLPGGALRKGSAETAAALPAAEDEEPETQSAVAGTGQVVVNTEPTGARVTLDGKPVGVSPLTLDGISAGSHVVVVSAPSGSVKRTIRVVADHSISLDVPIFSGWVAVFAPFVVTIAENSATLGTNEQGRLLVAPGRHMLVLSNDGLGFSTAQQVDVTAGAVAAIHLDPKGQVNINAVPWAEVWWDGRKIGETPIANYTLPLGTQEFVFKNPQFGERRATATIRASEAAAVSVDFSKPPQP